MIYYVNAKAGRDGNGSKAMPFKRINDAAKVAVAGDEVVVAPGIYRESVHPVNPGREDARIVYRSEEPLGAVITGAEELTGWTRYQGNVWVNRVNNGLFGGYNPYTTQVRGDWYFAPEIRHTGAVFLNDNMMYETTSLEECAAAQPDPCAFDREKSTWKWYTEQDGDETVLYANFKDLDPNAQKVEILARRNCFMPEENGIGYITVSGFDINKAATTWAPPAAYQDGMIGPHWSKGWIIEDCEIWGSKCCGISLGKYCDPENDMYFFHKHVKSPTQMERDAVCRGQYHGWLKEKVGGHIVRRCHVHHCEQTGIVGRMGGVFSTIEDCHIHHVCNSQQLGGAETAGIKLHAAIDVTIRRNHIHNCIMGVWLDWEAQGARISQNLLHLFVIVGLFIQVDRCHSLIVQLVKLRIAVIRKVIGCSGQVLSEPGVRSQASVHGDHSRLVIAVYIGIRIPGIEFDQIDICLNPNIGQLICNNLRGSFMRCIVIGNRDREGKSVRIASLFQQFMCLIQISGIGGLRICVVIELRSRDHIGSDNMRLSFKQKIIDQIPVNGIIDCLPYAYVIKGFHCIVQEQSLNIINTTHKDIEIIIQCAYLILSKILIDIQCSCIEFV